MMPKLGNLDGRRIGEHVPLPALEGYGTMQVQKKYLFSWPVFWVTAAFVFNVVTGVFGINNMTLGRAWPFLLLAESSLVPQPQMEPPSN
jgi:hypothetical protein